MIDSLELKLNNLGKQLETVLHSIETLKSEERAIRLQISTIQQTIAIYRTSSGEQASESTPVYTALPKGNSLQMSSKKDYFNTIVLDVLEEANELINKKEIEDRIVALHGEARAEMLSQYLMQMKNGGLLCAVRLNNSHKRLYYGLSAWEKDQPRFNRLVKRLRQEKGMEVESFEWL